MCSIIRYSDNEKRSKIKSKVDDEIKRQRRLNVLEKLKCMLSCMPEECFLPPRIWACCATQPALSVRRRYILDKLKCLVDCMPDYVCCTPPRKTPCCSPNIPEKMDFEPMPFFDKPPEESPEPYFAMPTERPIQPIRPYKPCNCCCGRIYKTSQRKGSSPRCPSTPAF